MDGPAVEVSEEEALAASEAAVSEAAEAAAVGKGLLTQKYRAVDC